MITDRDVDAIRREYTNRVNNYVDLLNEEAVLRDLAIARKKIEELEEEISELIQSCTCSHNG